jgi:hypothetical protein
VSCVFFTVYVWSAFAQRSPYFSIPDILQRTVRTAATSLISGQAVKASLLETVRGNLQWLLNDYLKATLVELCQDFGLEALARLPPASSVSVAATNGLDKDGDVLCRFTVLALRTLSTLVPTDVASTEVQYAAS